LFGVVEDMFVKRIYNAVNGILTVAYRGRTIQIITVPHCTINNKDTKGGGLRIVYFATKINMVHKEK